MGRRLYVGNLSYQVQESELEQLFAQAGSVASVFVPRDKFTLRTPREKLSTYTFNTHTIQHRFCGTCGIAPFAEAKMPDGAEMACINVRCIPAVDLASLEIQPWDGQSH